MRYAMGAALLLDQVGVYFNHLLDCQEKDLFHYLDQDRP